MNIYPKAYFNNVQEITIGFLLKNKIKALILDVDNTLIDYNKNLSEDIIEWSKIPYKLFAKKPFKKGFLEVKNILKIKEENIAVVGDQIFTDIIGGNSCKMFTILVDPIDKKDYWYTAWKRPLENKIKSKIPKETDLKF